MYIFYPQIFSLLYGVIITILFFIKKKIKTLENSMFGFLIVTNIIGLLLDITGFTLVHFRFSNIVLEHVARFILVYMIIWIFMMTLYIYIAAKKITYSDKEQNNKAWLSFIKVKKIITVLIFFISLIVFIFPMEVIQKDGSLYTNSLSNYMLYGISGLLMFVWIILMAVNNKNIREKKFYPFYAYMFFGSIVSLIQYFNPQMLLITPLETFITFLMYFTIENPDVRMIEQLNMAKEQADKANRAKTDFLSSMSHEIRTPLNAIVGFSECIVQANDLDEAKENASDIVGASKTLLEIVNGILDISKIEAGKLEIHNSSYNSRELFDSIIKLAKGRLGDKDLDFRINIAEDIPETLFGDHANLKKVIINLLTNAIKYTDHGYFELKINCVKTDDICRLMISVEDSGRGIKKEDLDKLFTKFQRLDEDRNTTIEGTGLGLAITKQLVELMGGKIVVQSTFGEGSKFSVALDQKITNDVVEKQTVEEKYIDLTGKKILIVDDNSLNLKVASKIIAKYNPTIETAMSGMECIEKIDAGNHYDLILLDDMMPRMSGGETLIRLKQKENFNIPVVALTANALTGMEEKYLSQGFNDYLAKPIEKDKLYKVLIKYLSDTIKAEEKNIDLVSVEEEKEVLNETKEESQNILKTSNNEKLTETKEMDLTGKRILIVDDNKLNIKVASLLLKPYNPTVDSVLSGDECIDKIKSGEKYDLIFMDDMMPEVSGVETFHELEKIENFNIPVVALTANAIDGMREQYLKEGFNEYLSKPINKDELDRILNLILKNDNPTKEEIKESIQPEVNKTIEKSVLEIPKQEEIIEQSIENKPRFEELPEELFEIDKSLNIPKPEKNEEIPKKEEVYKEKIETPKQFSPVYITKDEYKNDTNYLKENNIDVDHGIELLGDLSMYNETMEEFYNNIRERVIKLRTFKENNDLANYAIEAHALKSDSKYLGFTELAQKSFDHEIKAKENNIEFVNNDFDRLLNSLNRVLNIIKKYLGK